MANSIEFDTGNVILDALSVIDQLDDSGSLNRPINNLSELNGPTSTLGLPTTAVFSGSSFGHDSSVTQVEFLETEAFDVSANIRAESRHVGKSGHVYVVVILENGDAYAKDSTGSFFLLENDFSNISAFEENILLPPSKDIVVFENLSVGENSGLAGNDVNIFVGYALSENLNEIFYHEEPIRISIKIAP